MDLGDDDGDGGGSDVFEYNVEAVKGDCDDDDGDADDHEEDDDGNDLVTDDGNESSVTKTCLKIASLSSKESHMTSEVLVRCSKLRGTHGVEIDQISTVNNARPVWGLCSNCLDPKGTNHQSPTIEVMFHRPFLRS